MSGSGSPEVSPLGWDGDAPDPIWSADTPEELWQVLATGRFGGASTRHEDAVELFEKHHRDGQQGAIDTALLLCTDNRWHRCAGKVIAGIEDTGILSDSDLAQLAERFLWEDTCAYSYPLEWVSPEGLMVEVELMARSTRRVAVIQEDPKAAVPSRRPVRPPLRRWAAAGVVRRAPEKWRRVVERAGELGGHDGGFVLSGILDAIGTLDEKAVEDVLAAALSWPSGAVRRLGLQLVAARGGSDVVRKMAASDPDAGVRQRASRLEPKVQATQGTLFEESR